MFENELKRILTASGADAVGFCALGEYAAPDFPQYRYAVSVVRALSGAVVDTIDGKPTPVYFQHYRITNTKLELIALDAVSFIERAGYSALTVAASQSMPGAGNYRGIFQHKTAAVLSGMGFIGRSGLLLSPEYGSRIRLATVLTDMPLENVSPVIENGCGECRACADACPAGAISGKLYTGGSEPLIDVEKCSAHMKPYKDIGRGAVCGICMAVCPYSGRRGKKA